jgi:hypothetical protein
VEMEATREGTKRSHNGGMCGWVLFVYTWAGLRVGACQAQVPMEQPQGMPHNKLTCWHSRAAQCAQDNNIATTNRAEADTTLHCISQLLRQCLTLEAVTTAGECGRGVKCK